MATVSAPLLGARLHHFPPGGRSSTSAGAPLPAEADAAEARAGARWSPSGSRGRVPRHRLQRQMQPSPRCPGGCKSKTQEPTGLAPPGARREGLVQPLLGGGG